MSIAIGDPLPELTLPATGGQEIALGEQRGHRLIIYFYPKANTPGCTREGEAFRDASAQFAATGTIILGASRDGIRALENFKAKHAFPFELLSDRDETLCRAFDVIRLKKMYGKESLGVERSTFLFDAAGILRREWRAVKVAGHAAEVLAATETLAQN